MITAFANMKGGTGKSSISENVSRILAAAGKKVLHIDLNLQADSTRTLLKTQLEKEGEKLDATNTIYATLVNKEDLPIYETDHPNLHVVPASFDLWEADVQVYEQGESNRHSRLKTALLDVSDKYDYVIMDLPNYPGLPTLNALVAAEDVVVVTTPSEYDAHSVDLMRKLVKKVNESHNPDLKIKGILLNKVEGHLKSHQDVIEKMKSDSIIQDLLFETVIRKNSDMQKAQGLFQTVTSYNRFSNSGKDLAQFVNEAFL